ncbi:MAG TPA: VOC family protein [Nannocystis sp.]|jgi:PhnB protein
MPTKLSPHLIVAGAARAIEFYKKAFDARELSRYADEKRGGHIVCAELTIGDQLFTVADEERAWKNDAPGSLGGSPVILNLEVPDVDAVGARLVAEGATVIYPIADHFYGERSGRFQDPFGHLWLVTKKIKQMTPAEIQAGVDAYEG